MVHERGTSRSPASQISCITDFLYLAGARGVRAPLLRELGITMVVNTTVELPLLPLDGIEVVALRIQDAVGQDLESHLDEITDRIEVEREKGGRVLVHCVAGVSRSPAVVLGYLVKYARMSLRMAFQQVRSSRPCVRPNAGFFRQLIAFEEKIHGSASVAMVTHAELNLSIPDVCEDELEILKDKQWVKMISARRNFENQYA